MDSQFVTLTRSFHDNYMQHQLTGSKSSQSAYEHAEKGLQKIISDIKTKITPVDTVDIPDIISQKDEHTAAQMRQPAPETPSYIYQYVAIGVLAVVAIGLAI